MSRLTLRLPDSLHRQLEQMASNEAVSLNQYIVFALTRQVTLAYTVQSVPEKAVAEQRAAYTALLQNLGTSSYDEIKKAMDKRQKVKPENGLTQSVIEKVKRRIEKRK